MEKILFIKEFFKNWKEMGSITPSSKFLIKKILQPIDFDKAKVIIELGPGSGPITKVLLSKMASDSELSLFELNKDFCEKLRKIDDNRIAVHNKSALDVDKYFQEESVDCVISGIPIATLSRNDKMALLKASHKVLKPGGQYLQFQYSLQSRGDIENTFGNVSSDFTLFNFPPAFVILSVKK